MVDGYLLSNVNRKVIFIKDIKYNNKYVGTDKEIRADSVTVSLISNNNVIYKSDNINDNKLANLEEYLDDISIVLDTDEVKNIDLKELYLSIEITYDNEVSNFYVNISMK